MPDSSDTFRQNAERRSHDASFSRRRAPMGYPEGLSRGYQRVLGLAREGGDQQCPCGELDHALLCGSYERVVDPQRCIAAPYPGHLLCQDTFFVGDVKGLGEMKGPGRLYVQSVVDAYCSFAFAKLYSSRASITTVDILDEIVLPFYEQQGLKVERVFTDNGKEYGGLSITHPYETFLGLCGIEHVRGSSFPAAADNPSCAQFHRILEEEFFAPALRKNFNLHLDTLQQDLDAYLKHYNCERPCPGLRTQGRSPYRAFLDGMEAKRETFKAQSENPSKQLPEEQPFSRGVVAGDATRSVLSESDKT
jgi:hypothetical protein